MIVHTDYIIIDLGRSSNTFSVFFKVLRSFFKVFLQDIKVNWKTGKKTPETGSTATTASGRIVGSAEKYRGCR